MSRTIFRGRSPNGATELAVVVADTGEEMISVTLRDQTGRALGHVYLDPEMADALGSHLRNRALDVWEEQEARNE